MLANVRPSGKYLMEDFFYAGGLRALLSELKDLLHLDCRTVNGKTLGENLAWLAPGGYDSASGNVVLCFQSYVVKTPHHNILVDSCIGNDKNFPLRPTWNKKSDGNWMSALKAAGLGVEDIDFVMCTHLHGDHVGWNTMLRDGRWIPTFPNAKYLFSRSEDEYGDPRRNPRRTPTRSAAAPTATACCR